MRQGCRHQKRCLFFATHRHSEQGPVRELIAVHCCIADNPRCLRLTMHTNYGIELAPDLAPDGRSFF